MKITKVEDQQELLKVILFLKSAFNWSENKAMKLNKDLLDNNKDFDIYGYCIKNHNNNLVGALLIFYQGHLKYKKKEIQIINMASWYVDPVMRGYESLKMIKKLINDYPNHLITNLTSNLKAYKILKAFGFKESSIVNKKFTILSLLNNPCFLQFNFYKFLFKNYSSNTYTLQKRFSKGNSYCRKFNFNNDSIFIVFAPTIWEKRISIFHFKMKGIRVLYSSNPNFLKNYLYYIFFFNFLKNFSIFTTIHCALHLSKRNEFISTKQLYLAPYDDFALDKELALGSELAFI